VGFLDNLISRPILHGFVSASAAIIFVGQFDSFLGFSVPQQEWKKLVGVAQNLDMINWWSVGIACASVVAILTIDFVKARFGPKFGILKFVPTPLIIVICSTAIVWIFELDDKNVAILNDVDGGFPIPKVPLFYEPHLIRELAIEGILIGIVGFVESNAIAKVSGEVFV
jgi:SulP family sulfate permease